MRKQTTGPLVLASSSPYRKAILERLQVDFEIFTPDIDESPKSENEPINELVARLAEEKARAAQSQYQEGLIIGSDLLVVVDGQVLGKPETHEEAIKQLTFQSGKQSDVLTALCLLNAKTNNIQVDIIKFSVKYRTLTPTQIENYLLKEKPYNCASSLKTEGLGIALLEKMIGNDPTSIVGLPLISLIKMLEAESFFVL